MEPKQTVEAPRWLKITVGLLFLALALILCIVGFSGDKAYDKPPLPIQQNNANIELDNVIAAIKTDSLFKVKAVQIRAGMLYVAVTDLDKGLENGNAYYFLKSYSLNQNKSISKCFIYKWRKGDKPESIFEKREADGSMLADWRNKEICDSWASKCLYPDGSCRAVAEYLVSNLDDADSYEHVATKYYYEDKSNSMHVICRYRAKNSYGALTLHVASANVSLDGALLNFNDIE